MSDKRFIADVMNTQVLPQKKSLSVLIHLGRLDNADTLFHYTLAQALQRVTQCCVISAESSNDVNDLLSLDHGIVCLDPYQTICDWRVDIVVTCDSSGFSEQLGANLKSAQGSVWVERHENAQGQSDALWNHGTLPQPRYQTWCDSIATADFFTKRLGEAIEKLPSPGDPADAKAIERNDESAEPRRDLVLFWKQNDSLLYGRRSDMVAKTLAAQPDVRQVLVIDAPLEEAQLVNWANAESTSQYGELYRRTVGRLFRQDDVGKLSFRTFLYNSNNKKWANKSQYFAFLQRQLDELGIDVKKAIFWLYPKLLKWGESLVPHFKPAQVVVDVVDDHRRWPGIDDKRKSKLTEHYRLLLSQADKVITNCEQVQMDMREFGVDIDIYPNACDYPPSFIEPVGDPHYQQICAHRGPVFGYVGNLESKLDLELLQKISTTFPQALLVLIGSTHASDDLSALQALPNVVFVGVRNYGEAGAFIRRFTVALVPHKRTPLTASMNPLKVLVYLSYHVPVVSTDVENIPDFDYIWQAKNHGAFIQQLKSVLALSQAELLDAKKFEQFARTNSWQQRLAPLLNQLFI